MGTDCQNHCWPFWLVVGTHWQSESVRGRQMQGLDVSELLVEGKQILIWKTLSSWAGGLERVCGEEAADMSIHKTGSSVHYYDC